MHTKDLTTAGAPLGKATKALIMLHGRGASASDILSVAEFLQVKNFALIAPQATNNTWYPYSFLMPQQQNEPWLSSALAVVDQIVADLKAAAIEKDNIYFLGFSQGACLTLEYVARNAASFGGVIAFTGGLIGDKVNPANYRGSFNQTPIFIGTSNPDPHVPVSRVKETETILRNMDAAITVKIYDNMGHTISRDEIDVANNLVLG